MNEYRYGGMRFKPSATFVGRELEHLEEEKEISPENVIEWAREHVNGALHECFEWDDSVAGEKYRLRQATDLIKSIKIVLKEKDKTEVVPKYISVLSETNRRDIKHISVFNMTEDDFDGARKRMIVNFEDALNKYKNIFGYELIESCVLKALDKLKGEMAEESKNEKKEK